MRIVETDIAVVGGGAAGLAAATEAARAGARVLVLDENRLPGGQLFKQIHKFFGSHEHHAGTRGYQIGRELLAEVEDAGAEVWLNTVVYGMQPDTGLGVIHDGKNTVIRAKKVIVATGAKENYMAFPGSTLPGVMGAGAAQTMANLHRVLPGKRIVMLGSGNVGLIVSYQLMQAGADVLAIVEAAPAITGYGVHAAKIRRAGVPILVGHTVTRCLGTDQVEQVEIAAVDDHFRPIPGTEQLLDADTVCLAVGLNPMTELLWMAGCRFTYIGPFGGHVPLHSDRMETTVPGLYVAGDVTGVEEASSAMEEGRLAGISAAMGLGYLTEAQGEEKLSAVRARLDALRSGAFGATRRKSKETQIQAMADYLAKEAAR